jgi:hypothetical protein
MQYSVGAYGLRPATNAERPATNADNAPFDALVDDVADYGAGRENDVGVSHTPLRLRSPSKTVGATQLKHFFISIFFKE